jgi:hypothetical protein
MPLSSLLLLPVLVPVLVLLLVPVLGCYTAVAAAATVAADKLVSSNTSY